MKFGPVPYGSERLNEAQKHGIKKAIVPIDNTPKKNITIQVTGIRQLQELQENSNLSTWMKNAYTTINIT